ncbi:protein ecdysoneless homolog [Galleria mellonella]|uniref:Protein ecdysoneless homolog n=1 Tax=Galleria mellonella TaxID=7137 RepID=A0A6J1X7P9_GALME|nr:protein ecdysoneless homolog [Galleria mellonella]
MEDTSIAYSDDSVHCYFYSSLSKVDASYWERLCENINKTIVILSEDHIWHRDEFRVHIPLHDNSHGGIPFHLESSTCFGDNIEDEWFIVYIVLEITKQFKDLIVQIKDNDGEFLLIEAADHLQSWANPNTTENRVYIYRSQIHLIPDTIIDLSTKVNVSDAIKIITNETEQTRVSSEIHQSILNRISEYPQKIKENLHRTVVTLPLDIAALLILKPSLISAIVNAYCSHDMIDVQVCKNIQFDNCVTTEITFTKCLYAMLIHSKLINITKCIKIINNDKRSLIGLKLACGYEILTRNVSNDIFSSKGYLNFLNNLKRNGYFKNNIEGSKMYTDLLDKAKNYYKCMECPINTYLSSQILQIMSTTNFLKIKETLKQFNKEDYTEDNEDWLNINPEQLNDLLNSRYGKQTKLNSGDMISSQTITTKLKDFLKQTSDFEGVEPTIDIDENKQVIDFDPDDFVNSIEKMLNIISRDKDNSDENTDFSDDSDESLPNELVEKKKDLKMERNNIEEREADNTFINIIKSMKEEEGSSGPSSNLLRTVGIHKMDLLDSDDDLN